MAVNVFHLGWAKAWYIHGNKDILFVIDNKKELEDVAGKVGISEKAIAEILVDIDLRDRKIGIIYVTKPALNYFYGVKKIESVASKIHIHVVEMACPNSSGSAAMGGQVIVLSAPKDVPEIVLKVEQLDLFNEDEYKTLNYEENKQRVDSLMDANPYNENYTGKLYMNIYGGLSDEEIKNERWFKDIDPQFNDQVLRTIKAYREYYELEKKVHKTYEKVEKRLLLKSYDPINEDLDLSEDRSFFEIKRTSSLKMNNKSFTTYCVLGVLGVLAISVYLKGH